MPIELAAIWLAAGFLAWAVIHVGTRDNTPEWRYESAPTRDMAHRTECEICTSRTGIRRTDSGVHACWMCTRELKRLNPGVFHFDVPDRP
jgi:hypothetical protein